MGFYAAQATPSPLPTERPAVLLSDAERFAQLYERFSPVVYGIFLLISKDKCQVETMFLQVFEDVREELDSFRVIGPGSMGRILCFMRTKIAREGLSTEMLSRASLLADVDVRRKLIRMNLN